ncbi:baseplate J/gp47 family protein [Streptomyces sp. NPDC017448]|uniref:baseplate J/gp47 family protein n=1 Tax=Streptomyces sp. NPDC017448 TaxID=3364996 RepID=UPI00379A3ED4
MTTPPPIDYTAKDFRGFREAMLSYARTAIPEWTTRNPADFGVVMVELLSYCLDTLSYYQDRLVGEAYLGTATQRSSVLDIARLLSYTPYPAQAATGTVSLRSDETQLTPVTIPVGTQFITTFQDDLQGPLIFETTQAASVPPSGGVADVPVVEGATQETSTITLTRPDASDQTISVVELAVSDGTADQRFTVPSKPVDLSTVRLFAVYPGAPVEWVLTSSLLDATSDDRVFEANVEADGSVVLLLGDDVNGAVPEAGIPLMLSYRVGSGSRGNLAANELVDVASVIPGVSVLSSSEMSGGWDAESTDSIRRNASRAWGTQNRAVTVRDYSSLALAVPGVDKASALAGSSSLITTFILGALNSAPSQGLLEATTRHLQARAMAGTAVTVQTGTLIPVAFGTPSNPVVVGVMPQYRRADTQLLVTQALQELLAPSRTTFRQRITIADAYAAVHGLPGVLYIQIPVMARADQVQTGTADVLCREWEVPVAGTINISAVGGV